MTLASKTLRWGHVHFDPMTRAAFIQISIALLALVVPEVWKEMFESLRQSPYWRIIQSLCIAWIVVVAFIAMPWSPIMAWGLGNRLKSVLLFALAGALLFGGGFYLIAFIHDRLPISQTAVSSPAPLSKSDFDAAIADIGRQIGDVRDLNLSDPSKDSGSKLSFLKKEHDRLAEKPELTTQQKEVLDDQAITLDSLEAARKDTVARRDIEKKLQENEQRQAEIVRQDSVKKAAEAKDRGDREFAEKFLPIYDYAVMRLNRDLQNIAKLSSEKVISNFPEEQSPSITKSDLVKDGKVGDGEHLLRLGSREGWAFRISVNGTQSIPPMQHHIIFRIEAGVASVGITAPRPMTSKPYLRVAYTVDKKQISQEVCDFTEYQKPIDRAIKALIDNEYYEHPIAKH